MTGTTTRAHANNLFLSALIIGVVVLLKFIFFRQLTELDQALNIPQLTSAYLTNIAAAMAVALFVLLIRKIWVIILLLVICDVWLLANLMYFNANFTLLNWAAITTITELPGFEASIGCYVDWLQILFPLTTLAAYFMMVGLADSSTDKHRCSSKITIGYVVIAFVCWGAGATIRHRVPFTDSSRWNIHDEERAFLRSHSPLAHFGKTVWEVIQFQFVHFNSGLPLTEDEQRLVPTSVLPDTASSPLGHLVYILIESMESWAMTAQDATGTEVCPYLNHFIKTYPVVVSLGIETQQMYGRSGDGQLITQTGLLPLLQGVACMEYGANTYPNLAHFYPDSKVLNPFPRVWNQRVTTYSYGFKDLREPDAKTHQKGTDSLMFVWAQEELEHATSPMYLMVLTIDTHAPFRCASPSLIFDVTYSDTEQAYLQCVHHTDQHLGRFLAWADTAAVMQNATIVITADHNHFPREDGKGLCPLIIYSPKVHSTITIPQAYQMDIFPTILHLIGQDTYPWHGLGRNLLDSNSIRPCSINEAYRLSDKLIRRNYFAQ